MKKIISLSIFLWILSLTVSAQKSEIFIKDGYAIRGYDAVAYFTENKPIIGSEQFSFSWNGATWLFSNNKNKESFQKNPEKYAPQYGGYCAYGLSRGYKATTEADAFTIVDGKLYLNYNLDVRSEWNKDQKGYIGKADKNWPEVKTKSL